MHPAASCTMLRGCEAARAAWMVHQCTSGWHAVRGTARQQHSIADTTKHGSALLQQPQRTCAGAGPRAAAAHAPLLGAQMQLTAPYYYNYVTTIIKQKACRTCAGAGTRARRFGWAPQSGPAAPASGEGDCRYTRAQALCITRAYLIEPLGVAPSHAAIPAAPQCHLVARTYTHCAKPITRAHLVPPLRVLLQELFKRQQLLRQGGVRCNQWAVRCMHAYNASSFSNVGSFCGREAHVAVLQQAGGEVDACMPPTQASMRF